MDAETLRLIGEIIGWVAVAEGFLIFLSNKREHILIFKFIDDILWATSLFLLGNYTGAILNAIGMGREVVFYNRDKRKWASGKIWLVFFLLATAVSPMYSLISGKEGWYAILPAIGSIAAVIGFYSRSAEFSRYIGFFANGVWMIYNIICKNTPAIISSSILLLSGLIGTIWVLIHKHRLKKNAVPVAAEPDEAASRKEFIPTDAE